MALGEIIRGLFSSLDDNKQKIKTVKIAIAILAINTYYRDD